MEEQKKKKKKTPRSESKEDAMRTATQEPLKKKRRKKRINYIDVAYRTMVELQSAKIVALDDAITKEVAIFKQALPEFNKNVKALEIAIKTHVTAFAKSQITQRTMSETSIKFEFGTNTIFTDVPTYITFLYALGKYSDLAPRYNTAWKEALLSSIDEGPVIMEDYIPTKHTTFKYTKTQELIIDIHIKDQMKKRKQQVMSELRCYMPNHVKTDTEIKEYIELHGYPNHFHIKYRAPILCCFLSLIDDADLSNTLNNKLRVC